MFPQKKARKPNGINQGPRYRERKRCGTFSVKFGFFFFFLGGFFVGPPKEKNPSNGGLSYTQLTTEFFATQNLNFPYKNARIQKESARETRGGSRAHRGRTRLKWSNAEGKGSMQRSESKKVAYRAPAAQDCNPFATNLWVP